MDGLLCGAQWREVQDGEYYQEVRWKHFRCVFLEGNVAIRLEMFEVKITDVKYSPFVEA